jgi:hypothetical protein
LSYPGEQRRLGADHEQLASEGRGNIKLSILLSLLRIFSPFFLQDIGIDINSVNNVIVLA